MDLPLLETNLLAALTSTAGLTAGEKTKLRNRMVSEYPEKWQAFLVSRELTDTAANRGLFVAVMTIGGFWADIYKAGSARENLASIPAPETMEG
jgi:hypothetical protein